MRWNRTELREVLDSSLAHFALGLATQSVRELCYNSDVELRTRQVGKAGRAMSPEPEALVDKLKQYFTTTERVVVAYLFGSHARGQAGPLSDVDVAVLLDDTIDGALYFDLRLAFMGELDGLLGGRPVDVAILNEAPLALAYRVLRDGILLTCRDENARIMFTARTVSMYLDFKPVMERHERAILQRAREGKLLDGYNPHRGALERYRRLRERLAGHSEPEL